MRKANLNILLAVCVFMMTLVGPVGAVTHYVSPGQSIQAAIDTASNGDEIEVAPGTYNEAINFGGKAVRLYSSSGPDVTTIDGTGNYHVVKCVSGENANTILEGFTITGGNADGIDASNQGGGMYNRDSSSTVKNCTFTGNSAGYGGGMLNDSSSPTITDCNFIDNTATDFGGGIENYDGGSPTFTNCLFSGNTAENGGGMMNNGCSPTVTNCTFTDNTATYYGGGMYNYANSSPTVTNCTFSGNSTSGHGGGMYNEDSSSPTVTNCTFTDNTATNYGGGMYNKDSSPIVNDCNFTGNSGDAGGGMSTLWGSPRVINCNFRSNTARNYWGGGMWNFGGSPTVTNCTFSENSAGSNGGGIEIGADCILSVTNCSFTGNSSNSSGGGMSNGGNGWTVTNCTFIGNSANNYGGGMNTGTNSTITNCILWGDTPDEIYDYYSTATVTYSDVQGGWTGMGNIDADPCFVDADANDLRLLSDSPCVDIGNTSAVPPDTTDLDGDGDTTEPIPFDLNGDPRVWNDIVDMGALEYAELRVHNVTQNTSYIEIQRAINEANNGDEIEVAPGTYYEAINFKGKAIRLYSSGGPNDTTIDGTGKYHVVQCINGEGPNTVLEGFTITGGNANGTGSYSYGGGMYNVGSSPTVSNCTFIGNSASNHGGGMYNGNNSNPTVSDCNFTGNSAYAGGGMRNENSSPRVTDCTFSGNRVFTWGGGMWNWDGSPTVTNCTFTGNTAGSNGGGIEIGAECILSVTNCYFTDNLAGDRGGGMSNGGKSWTVTNCTFTGNTAGTNGGGMWNWSNSTVTNCTFISNSANNKGGGMGNGAYSTVTNCTFIGNSANDGGGVYDDGIYSTAITNCILWGDEPNEICDSGTSSTTVRYSDIEGSYSGKGNIDVDPCFVDPYNPDPNLWNLRLQPDSPCIDAGDTTAVPGGTWADIGGNPRVLDDSKSPDTGVSFLGLTVDMGAYEFDCMAIAGDVNCDGVVDFKDLAILCGNWLAGTAPE